jgi:hypothetical protein
VRTMYHAHLFPFPSTVTVQAGTPSPSPLPSPSPSPSPFLSQFQCRLVQRERGERGHTICCLLSAVCVLLFITTHSHIQDAMYDRIASYPHSLTQNTAAATLLLHCRYTVVTLLVHCCYTVGCDVR